MKMVLPLEIAATHSPPRRGGECSTKSFGRALLLLSVLSLCVCVSGFAQNAPSAKASAPIDPTGYWVTIITPDWRERTVPVLRRAGD